MRSLVPTIKQFRNWTMPSKWGVISGIVGIPMVLLGIYTFISSETYTEADIKKAKAAIRFELVDNISVWLDVLSISETPVRIEDGEVPFYYSSYTEPKTSDLKLTVERLEKHSDALITSNPSLVHALREHYQPSLDASQSLIDTLKESKLESAREIFELQSDKRRYEMFDVVKNLIDEDDQLWLNFNIDSSVFYSDKLLDWAESVDENIQVSRFLMKTADLVAEPFAAQLLYMCNSKELRDDDFDCNKHLLERYPFGTKEYELLGGIERSFGKDALLVVPNAAKAMKRVQLRSNILEYSGLLQTIENSRAIAESEVQIVSESGDQAKLVSAFIVVKMREGFDVADFKSEYTDAVFSEHTLDEERVLLANFKSRIWKKTLSIKNRPQYINKILGLDGKSATAYIDASDQVKVAACSASEGKVSVQEAIKVSDTSKRKLIDAVKELEPDLSDADILEMAEEAISADSFDTHKLRRIAGCVELRKFLTVADSFDLDTIINSSAYRKFKNASEIAFQDMVFNAISGSMNYASSLSQ